MNFDRVSSFYDESIVPIWGRPFAQLLLQQCALPLSGSTLEAGCGTGYLARYFSEHLVPRARIIGLEPSTDMLEVARQRSEAQIRDKRIFFLHQGLEHLRFADDVFDLVYSNLGLHYVEQPDALLVEALRVLKPGCSALYTLPLRGSLSDFLGPVKTYLQENDETSLLEQLELDEMRYPPAERVTYMLRACGYESVTLNTHEFHLVFPDGHNLCHSPFIHYEFFEEWRAHLQWRTLADLKKDLIEIFDLLRGYQPISLRVHAACVSGTKEEYILLG